MYTPEHHPNCPAFYSFDTGDSEEDTRDLCKCMQCKGCNGEGEITYQVLGILAVYETYITCQVCEGAGRVMITETEERIAI